MMVFKDEGRQSGRTQQRALARLLKQIEDIDIDVLKLLRSMALSLRGRRLVHRGDRVLAAQHGQRVLAGQHRHRGSRFHGR